jgi:hypothetical protein
MLGQEDGFDAIAVLDIFHLVLVIFSPSLEVRGSKDDNDSLICGLLGYILDCPCGPRFKAMFTLLSRLRNPRSRPRSCYCFHYRPFSGFPSVPCLKNPIFQNKFLKHLTSGGPPQGLSKYLQQF